MNRFSDSNLQGGWPAKIRINHSGSFQTDGVSFPFEPIDYSAEWPTIDASGNASRAFWYALFRKRLAGRDSQCSLSSESIGQAAIGLNEAELFDHLTALKKKVESVADAFVVLTWLNIQIETEVAFGMLNLIVDELYKKKTLSRAG